LGVVVVGGGAGGLAYGLKFMCCQREHVCMCVCVCVCVWG